MLNFILDIVNKIDSILGPSVHRFLNSYYPPEPVPSITSLLPIFIKTIIYGLIVLVPFVIFKFLHPHNNVLSWFIIPLLILIFLAISGVFFGYFQILYY